MKRFAFVAAAALAAAQCLAQPWPSRPVRLVVPDAPGEPVGPLAKAD